MADSNEASVPSTSDNNLGAPPQQQQQHQSKQQQPPTTSFQLQTIEQLCKMFFWYFELLILLTVTIISLDVSL